MTTVRAALSIPAIERNAMRRTPPSQDAEAHRERRMLVPASVAGAVATTMVVTGWFLVLAPH
ncbi:MAG: hypothetical protein QOE37_1926 [Microbacteriaceae bacterium]|jgi:hypothetical protein|nr:hypothetical protein [Microbacteriaceae bacterium]